MSEEYYKLKEAVPEQTLADNILSAVNTLNDAISQARLAGLLVEMSTWEVEEVSVGRIVQITGIVARPLT